MIGAKVDVSEFNVFNLTVFVGNAATDLGFDGGTRSELGLLLEPETSGRVDLGKNFRGKGGGGSGDVASSRSSSSGSIEHDRSWRKCEVGLTWSFGRGERRRHAGGDGGR